MDNCREAEAQNNYKNRENIITKMQQNLLHDVFDFDTQSQLSTKGCVGKPIQNCGSVVLQNWRAPLWCNAPDRVFCRVIEVFDRTVTGG